MCVSFEGLLLMRYLGSVCFECCNKYVQELRAECGSILSQFQASLDAFRDVEI